MTNAASPQATVHNFNHSGLLKFKSHYRHKAFSFTNNVGHKSKNKSETWYTVPGGGGHCKDANDPGREPVSLQGHSYPLGEISFPTSFPFFQENSSPKCSQINSCNCKTNRLLQKGWIVLCND